jgi:hypothetical protein
VNSSESNLFTIRINLGYGSNKGVFNTSLNPIVNDDILCSNNSTNTVTIDHLSSPTYNNLPKDFYIKYIKDTSYIYSFDINYGKQFVTYPSVYITPHSNEYIGVPVIQKNNLTSMTIYFIKSDGSYIGPSNDGITGLLGFDLIIIGPVKIGVTTGNSNKGWALNDNTDSEPSNIYTYLDVNLGSGYTKSDSVIISKNLKLLNSTGNVINYTLSTSILDYSQTLWLIDGNISLTTLTPQIGMVLIITSTDTGYDTGINIYNTNPTVIVDIDITINYQTLTTFEFTQRGDSIILYANDNNNFIILSQSSTINLS